MEPWADTDLKQILFKYKKFYREKHKLPLLLVIDYITEDLNVSVDLTQFDFSQMSEHRRYWDIVIEKQLQKIQQHRGIDDCWVPGDALFYGFGAFGSVYCDARLFFAKDTSYMHPVLDSLDETDSLELNAERFWTKVFREANRYFAEKAEGRFMMNVYPNPSPLDVVNILRGNEVFTDIYEAPDKLHKLLDKCTEAVINNIKGLSAVNSCVEGAHAFNRWIPKGALILEDAADLCSPAVYEEFAAPYTQRVIDGTGGAYIHHHSLGRHQYRNIASLKGLYVQQISSDPNCERPVTYLEEIFETAGNTVIDLECTAEEVFKHINTLKKGKAILHVAANDKKEAQELVAMVMGGEY